VKTWDNHGNESPFSVIKPFMTASELDGKTTQYPLQITDEYPVDINKTGNQNTFIDFGKAAFVRLKLTLASENGEDTITIRLGERSKDGLIDRKPKHVSNLFVTNNLFNKIVLLRRSLSYI
jgi:hypothetical protein